MTDISDLLWVEDTQETILIGAVAAGPAGEQGPIGPQGGERTTVQTSSMDQAVLDTCEFSSAKYLIQASTAADRDLLELWVTRLADDVWMTQAAVIGSASGTLATYACDVSGGDLRLLATPSSVEPTTFKILRLTVEV